jgi:maltose O-acetyltransferase
MMVRTQRDLMLAGEPYFAGDPELVAERVRCAKLVMAYNLTGPEQSSDRLRLLGELLGGLGHEIDIQPPFRCDYGYQIHVGARFFANYNLVALDVARISIGDDAQIGPNVQLLTAGHPVSPEARRNKEEWGKPITIGDNVWLGGGVIVCPGVTIGDNTVVGAGAVVTRDLPSNVVAVGNPARVLREL